MKLLALLFCVVAVQAASLISGPPSAWNTWAPRAEIAPRTFVDKIHYRTHAEPGSLAISGNSNPAAYGGWEYVARGVAPGKWYRFVGYYRQQGVSNERNQVLARLEWKRGNGKRAGQPDYAYRSQREGEWTRLTLEAAAPETTDAVGIQLWLANAPTATIWWDDVSLDEIPAPAARPVSIYSVNFRPSGSRTAAENVEKFAQVIDREVQGKSDIILLPEGITVVGTGKQDPDVAETVPGPTTARLGEVARKKQTYIVAGIYEREGQAVYNTAVLIDRKGHVAGKYRKVYLPREEYEVGLTPGSDYPVFQTDFGKIGVMICWDVQYADPARGLVLGGAEIILLPIWGGNQTLGKARAIENQVFIASSGYDYPTYIMDPLGEVLSEARHRGEVAHATVDLSRRYTEKWLGEMHGRYMKELRLDVSTEPRP
jgi:predicted amidohydrolase